MAAARLSGLAMGCVQVRRLTADQALAEMAAVLGKLPPERRQEALDQAASGYVEPGPTDVFHDRVSSLLARAGADLDRARNLRRPHGQSFVVREPS